MDGSQQIFKGCNPDGTTTDYLELMSLQWYVTAGAFQNFPRDLAGLAAAVRDFAHSDHAARARGGEPAKRELEHLQITGLPEPSLRWNPRLEEGLGIRPGHSAE